MKAIAVYAKSGEISFTRNWKSYRDPIAGVRGERCRWCLKIASCPIAMKCEPSEACVPVDRIIAMIGLIKRLIK